MKLLKSFEAFLKDHVNLNDTRLKRANDAFDTLTSFLKNASETKDLFFDTSRQGSLRQGTIIKPRVEETEFDVDLLLRMESVDGWGATAYLDAVHQAFKESDRYKELVDRRGKHRCVTIEYVGDFHVDVVPSIERDGQCWVMNRKSDEFEATDGDGYAKWFEDRNHIANAMLVRVVRMAKYLRDEHDWPVKSVLLTTLLGLQVYDDDTGDHHPDMPTSLHLLMGRLNEWLQVQESTPEVSNPALPEELFTRHWDDEAFEAFRDEVERLTGIINAAFVATNEETSIAKWQEAFGENFPILDEDLAGGELVALAPVTIDSASHAQPLATIAPRGERKEVNLKIDAQVFSQSGKSPFHHISSGTKVMAGRAIKFQMSTNAKGPYDVRWQVVNTGAHAREAGGLRGEFFSGRNLDKTLGPRNVDWEFTQYTGSHWIECFIVRDGVCIGRSGRFIVNIKNPQV